MGTIKWRKGDPEPNSYVEVNKKNPLPTTLYDENGRTFDITPDGKIKVDADLNIDSVTVTDVTIRDSDDPNKKIKVNEDGAVLTQLTGSNVEYVGYSTDSKNTIAPDAKRGDSFIELDTKDVYFHDGTDWVVF